MTFINWIFFSLKSFRYAGYRQFTWWAHGYLGKKIRRVIPSCAVKIIRNTFAAEDGIYTGYLPGDDDDDSAFDSELEQAWRDFLNISNISSCRQFLINLYTCNPCFQLFFHWSNYWCLWGIVIMYYLQRKMCSVVSRSLFSHTVFIRLTALGAY